MRLAKWNSLSSQMELQPRTTRPTRIERLRTMGFALYSPNYLLFFQPRLFLRLHSSWTTPCLQRPPSVVSDGSLRVTCTDLSDRRCRQTMHQLRTMELITPMAATTARQKCSINVTAATMKVVKRVCPRQSTYNHNVHRPERLTKQTMHRR